MTTLREAAQMALDALESSRVFVMSREKIKHPEGTEWYDERIEALRAALAAKEPELVAYGVLDEDGQIDWTCDYPFSDTPGWPDSAPLYTAPPQREWQGLTDEEYATLLQRADYDAAKTGSVFQNLRRCIEAKLREKNSPQ